VTHNEFFKHKYQKKIQVPRLVYNSIIRTILVIYSILVIYPVLWVILTSFKTNQEFYTSAWRFPENFLFENYVYAWNEANIGIYFINSIFITTISIFLTLIMSATTAYVLAKYNFPGNNFLEKLYMSGLLVPLVLGIIPTFLMFARLGLTDSWLGLIIIYSIFPLPFSIFVLISFFKSLPSELAQSARIDGCGEFGIFWRIMFPLAKSGLVTVSIFNFLFVWNDYIYAMTFISTESNRTLPVGLIRLTETFQFKTEWGPLFAGMAIVLIPSIIIYVIFQSQLTKGITSGGVKG
jgi:N-acetylglucosamine transport system permease protein